MANECPKCGTQIVDPDPGGGCHMLIISPKLEEHVGSCNFCRDSSPTAIVVTSPGGLQIRLCKKHAKAIGEAVEN